jgi:hypothetical protein
MHIDGAAIVMAALYLLAGYVIALGVERTFWPKK